MPARIFKGAPVTRQLVNEPAERAVLGAVLSDPALLLTFGDSFRAEIFGLPTHIDIAKAILELQHYGREIALASVVGRLPEPDGGYSHEGYLATRIADQADMALAQDLLEDLRERHTLRVLQETGRGLIEDASKETGKSADEIAELAIVALRTGTELWSRQVVSIGQAVDLALQRARDRHDGKESVGLPWFMPQLTSIMGPMERGAMIGLLADSKGGKTSLALQQVTYAAQYGCVVFFSIEMDQEELGFRHLAQHAQVDETRIAEGRYAEAEWQRILKAREELFRLPVVIDYRSSPTVASMRSQAMRSMQRSPLSLIVIDHLKLVRPQDSRLRAKIERFEEIMPDIKAMAKDLRTPVLLLMQRLRGALDRPNPKPQDQDAYGGGATLENLNSLLGIWRKDIWLMKNPPHPNASHEKKDNHEGRILEAEGRAQLISLARRRGRSHETVDCYFDGPTARFKPISDKVNQERLVL